jgi:hypothetical protein
LEEPERNYGGQCYSALEAQIKRRWTHEGELSATSVSRRKFEKRKWAVDRSMVGCGKQEEKDIGKGL